MSRRFVLALVAGSFLLGGLAAPSIALADTSAREQICIITYKDPQTGERDGFCVWFPDVLPPTPPLAG